MPATPEHKRIMVAMSGGVDSAVAAMLLQDAGHELRCVYFVMSDAHLPGRAAAQQASDALGLELDVLDLRADFHQQVVLPFCKAYCDGTTPNPCVACNPAVKFQALCDIADKRDCRYVATGHYAQIRDQDGAFVLCRAASAARDQSYMLYALPQTQLSRLLLPLGALQKQAVRRYAQQRGLAAADAPDSQEICFVPDGDYPAFIHRMGFAGKQGRFISPEGEPLGAHRGVEHYTVGQRRGLGVSLGQPVFIREITPKGDIHLAFSGQEYAHAIEIADCVFNPLYVPAPGQRYDVKVRSAAPAAPCKIADVAQGGLSVLFDDPLRAPAPGQAAVLYDGDCVAGGGAITRCF